MSNNHKLDKILKITKIISCVINIIGAIVTYAYVLWGITHMDEIMGIGKKPEPEFVGPEGVKNPFEDSDTEESMPLTDE